MHDNIIMKRTYTAEVTVEEYPLLNNAPIQEAVIDIQVKLPLEFDIKKLDFLYESFKDRYPQKKELRRFEGRLEFKKGKQPVSSISDQPRGYQFISEDSNQIVQLRADGFTFSKLKPYIDWLHLRDEAHNLWQFYRDATAPLITRIALRYINKINIPMPIKDFGEFLTAPPIVPESLPQGVNSFLTRVALHEPLIDAEAIITQALEPIIKSDFASIILDIDVFKNKPDGIEEKSAWEALEKLRYFKNKVFFKSITKKLEEMFK